MATSAEFRVLRFLPLGLNPHDGNPWACAILKMKKKREVRASAPCLIPNTSKYHKLQPPQRLFPLVTVSMGRHSRLGFFRVMDRLYFAENIPKIKGQSCFHHEMLVVSPCASVVPSVLGCSHWTASSDHEFGFLKQLEATLEVVRHNSGQNAPQTRFCED